MPTGSMTRRSALLLPFALLACGGPEPVFEPLRFNDLPPIQMNVTLITTEQRFVPAGVPPDVSNQDPVPPVTALTAMANDRLQAFGTSNKAVFAILDGSLTRQDRVINGSMAVSLTILDDGGAQLGFAEARVQSRHTGPIDDLRSVLYDMTKNMMADMNIEFEYQIRQHLKPWITVSAAPDTSVEQTPLDQPGAAGGQPAGAQPDRVQPSGGRPPNEPPAVGQPAGGQPSGEP